MPRWKIRFYPPPGENFSPEDYIEQNLSESDAENLTGRLEAISELEPQEWPLYIERFEKIWQLTSGDYRLYFVTDDNFLLVVCYVCMKKSQKAKRKDLDRAHRNLANYYEYKKSKLKKDGRNV